MTKAAFIALLGAPNTGKSTLLNKIVGQKLAIVTPKAQTTRHRITGICMEGQAQLIFVDVPGVFNAGDQPFEKAMVNAAWQGSADADITLLLVDAQKGITDEVAAIVERLAKYHRSPLMGELTNEVSRGGENIPFNHSAQSSASPSPDRTSLRSSSPTLPQGESVYLILNKIDLVPKPSLLSLIAELNAKVSFSETFMISALKGQGVDELRKALAGAAAEGPWLFPEDQVSDMPMRLLASEITREKCFFKLQQELPYALSVETEHWQEAKDKLEIHQIIYVQREGQKGIVLGKGGAMIKGIGSDARRELEKLLERKINLKLFVKVREDWKTHRETYSYLGLQK